jgi:hypothetical protein
MSQFKLQKVQQQAIQARLNYFLGADEYDRLFVGFKILHIENEVLTLSVRPVASGLPPTSDLSLRWVNRRDVPVGDIPIPLPKGKPLITLGDAALYVTKLPKAEHDNKERRAAMQPLLLVAEHNGPTMFARIGIMRALNRHAERVFDPSRKDHLGRWKLARDR